ncbi:MAG: MBL fold metallo-hydrolase [Deltaproteobacteria bacterium]|nr:MBL fold metallo-hydrolase [Deltaproteobacteria bacterium]
MNSDISGAIELQEADRVEITTIIDNYTDVLLESTNTVVRAPLAVGEYIADAPLAEHGLSILIKVFKNQELHTILFDAGSSITGVLNNLKLFDIDVDEVEAIVLSHGHMDHFGALEEILRRRKRTCPLVLHPHVFATSRGVRLPNKRLIKFPTLNEKSVIEAGADLVKTRAPYLLASGLIASIGEVERVTGFEKGMPNLWVERDGQIELDQVLDDQGVIINVKRKGLVVVSGCAHAGIINTVRHAQNITKISEVYAILGGFHLTGPFFRPIIGTTIEELKKINPEILVPTHCTGWDATNEIAREMPSQFVLTSVGTKFVF